MSDIAIRVENLSKLYRIGRAQSHGDSLRSQRHDTLRDAIADLRLRISDLTKRNPQSRCAGRRQSTIRNPQSAIPGILSCITEPTSGRAEICGGRVGSLLEVGTGFHPELTGRENIRFASTAPSWACGGAK